MILQGVVLLLVLIHSLVSQTDDLVCIRAFFRVKGKAAAGADRQKTACNIIGCCNDLTGLSYEESWNETPEKVRRASCRAVQGCGI